MEVKSLFEQLLFTTAPIRTVNSKGENGLGTGFVFEYKNKKDGRVAPFLVTNKHVIEDAALINIKFNIQEKGQVVFGKTQTIISSHEKWFGHDNPDIDVAVLPIWGWFEDYMNKGITLFFRPIYSDLVPTLEMHDAIDAIEDVIIVGYPNGIYDKKNLLPVVRKGITATPPLVDFNGNPTFLIDASIFPGSSGSPVLICNVGSYTKKGEGLYAGAKFIFLGIVASVFIKKDINEIEMITIPTKDIPVVQTQQMLDLGLVFKSSCIIETIETLLRKHGEDV